MYCSKISDLVISGHSREDKAPSYSQINMVNPAEMTVTVSELFL